MIYFVWNGAATRLDSIEKINVRTEDYGREWILVEAYGTKRAERVAEGYHHDRTGFGVSLPARYYGGIVYDKSQALVAYYEVRLT